MKRSNLGCLKKIDTFVLSMEYRFTPLVIKEHEKTLDYE
jgi:hypothetical protein